MNVDRPITEKTVCGLDAFSPFKHCWELLDFVPGAHVLENKQMTVNDVRCLSRKPPEDSFLYLCDVKIYLDWRLRAAARMERLSIQSCSSRQDPQQHLCTKVSTSETTRFLTFSGEQTSTWRSSMSTWPKHPTACAGTC